MPTLPTPPITAGRRPASPGEAVLYAPFLDYAFRDYSGASFVIRFWDDSIWHSGAHDGSFEIYLRTHDAWNALSSVPDDVSIEAKYVSGELRLDGDLYAAIRSLPLIEHTVHDSLPAALVSVHKLADHFIDKMSRLLRLGATNSEPRSGDVS